MLFLRSNFVRNYASVLSVKDINFCWCNKLHRVLLIKTESCCVGTAIPTALVFSIVFKGLKTS